MFKQVENMRKLAFKIMSKTFGGRSKEKNEPMFDQYPLKSLLRLLCFEDIAEAREACGHYNITVQQYTSRSSPESAPREIISWRATSFKDPKDPDKNTTIPFPPRKMIKTIESKRKGATRLAVCRGDVSMSDVTQRVVGREAAAAEHPIGPAPTLQASTTPPVPVTDAPDQQQREAIERARLVDEETRRRQAEATARLEEEKKEAARLEAEQRKKAAMEKEIARKREEALELARREREAQEKARREAEKRAEAERQRREEAERKRVAAEMERKRRAEEEEMRRRREEELRVRREAEERERVERKRVEAERLRLENERRHAEQLRRREQEARERAEAMIWEARANECRRRLLWFRWDDMFPSYLRNAERTAAAINRLGLVVIPEPAHHISRESTGARPAYHRQPTNADAMRAALELSIMKAEAPFINFSKLVRLDPSVDIATPGPRAVCHLVKVGIVVPACITAADQDFGQLCMTWLSSAMTSGAVTLEKGGVRTEARVLLVDACDPQDLLDCDAALVILHPMPSEKESVGFEKLAKLGSNIPNDVPRVCLSLDGRIRGSLLDRTKGLLSGKQTADFVPATEASMEAATAGLQLACRKLGSLLPDNESVLLERVTFDSICCRVVYRYMLAVGWFGSFSDVKAAIEQVEKLVARLLSSQNLTERQRRFPAVEFLHGSVVPNYFGPGVDLPHSWRDLSSKERIDSLLARSTLVMDLEMILNGANVSHADGSLSARVSEYMKERSTMASSQILYLPSGTSESVVNAAMSELEENLARTNKAPVYRPLVDVEPEVEEMQPQPTPLPARIEESTSPVPIMEQPETPPPPVQSPEFVSPRRRTPRGSKRPRLSADVQESRRVTAKLEALLRGDSVDDMLVGQSFLSSLLEGSQPLE